MFGNKSSSYLYYNNTNTYASVMCNRNETSTTTLSPCPSSLPTVAGTGTAISGSGSAAKASRLSLSRYRHEKLQRRTQRQQQQQQQQLEMAGSAMALLEEPEPSTKNQQASPSSSRRLFIQDNKQTYDSLCSLQYLETISNTNYNSIHLEDNELSQWQRQEQQATISSTTNTSAIHFALPQFSSSSSSSGGEDSDDCSDTKSNNKDHDHDAANNQSGISPPQDDEWWNNTQISQGIPSTKRKRLLRKATTSAVATTTQDDDDSMDDDIFVGRAKRISLSTNIQEKNQQCTTRYIQCNETENRDNSSSPSSSNNDFCNMSNVYTNADYSSKSTNDLFNHNSSRYFQNNQNENNHDASSPSSSIDFDTYNNQDYSNSSVLPNNKLLRYSQNNEKENNHDRPARTTGSSFKTTPPPIHFCSTTSTSTNVYNNQDSSSKMGEEVVYNGLRKSFHESPSLASRWAIATATKHTNKSRRISTSPFFLENVKNDKEEMEESPIRVLHELKHDPIDEFSDENQTRRKFPSWKATPASRLLPRTCASSSQVREQRKVSYSKMAMKTNPRNINIDETRGSANPYVVSRLIATSTSCGATNSRQLPRTCASSSSSSQVREKKSSYSKMAMKTNQINNDETCNSANPYGVSGSRRSAMATTCHNNENFIPRPWMNNTTSRLREATSSRSPPNNCKKRSSCSDDDNNCVIDMTQDQSDDDDVVYYNTISNAAESSSSSIYHRNDLFGGSGCGTDGVRIVEKEKDVDQEIKKKKKGRPKSSAAKTKRATTSTKTTAKGKKKRKGGSRKGSWGGGRKKSYKRKSNNTTTGSTTSTRSVWSSRESGVGAYTTYTRDVGLADVGGASITF